MSEPLTKQRPTVDLDQFEREMNSSVPYNDDPLAELARLVGEQHDPYGDVFAREAFAPAHPAPAHAAPNYAAPTYSGEDHGRREPAFGHSAEASAEASSLSPRLFGDFAAIEAGLRGAAVHGHPGQGHASQGYAGQGHSGHAEPAFDAAYQDQAYPEHAYHEGAEPQGDHAAYDPAWAAQGQGLPRPASRSRRPVVLMAATIAVGIVGIGTAFALKGHIGTSPREVKTILADASPTKVQPPADAVADREAAQDSAVLGKGQPAPTSLVSHEEQPVDVASAVQDRRTDASSVPVPPTPGQIQTAMADPSGAPAQGFPLADMPTPKRVRVVSVRPDGTILPNDNPPPAAIPAPRAAAGKTSDKAGPVAKPSTPKTAAKTTSRVTTPKSIDQLASADDAAAPEAAPKAAAPKKPKPQRVASADTGTPEATAAVSPDAAGTGGFAVQLAAPGSEADAKATSSKLAKKFAGTLGAHHLAFHKADSNGKSVYRVRVSSLSKADAVSLCDKLKADGGSCFVAKN